MKNDEIKLEKLKERILQDARRSCELLVEEKKRELSEHTAKRSEELLKNEKKAVEEAKVRAQMKRAQDVAAAEREAAVSLISRRDELTADLKKDLSKMLADYSKTDEYCKYVAEKALMAIKMAGGDKITATFFGEACSGLPEEIEVVRKEEAAPGGVIFEIAEKGIIIDYSFKTIIDAVIKDFHDIRIPG